MHFGGGGLELNCIRLSRERNPCSGYEPLLTLCKGKQETKQTNDNLPKG